jgi:hypothetical protein
MALKRKAASVADVTRKRIMTNEGEGWTVSNNKKQKIEAVSTPPRANVTPKTPPAPRKTPVISRPRSIIPPTPNCSCGFPCTLLESAKENENKGRKFYTPNKDTCGKKGFIWADCVKLDTVVKCYVPKEEPHYVIKCATPVDVEDWRKLHCFMRDNLIPTHTILETLLGIVEAEWEQDAEEVDASFGHPEGYDKEEDDTVLESEEGK